MGVNEYARTFTFYFNWKAYPSQILSDQRRTHWSRESVFLSVWVEWLTICCSRERWLLYKPPTLVQGFNELNRFLNCQFTVAFRLIGWCKWSNSGILRSKKKTAVSRGVAAVVRVMITKGNELYQVSNVRKTVMPKQIQVSNSYTGETSLMGRSTFIQQKCECECVCECECSQILYTWPQTTPPPSE